MPCCDWPISPFGRITRLNVNVYRIVNEVTDPSLSAPFLKRCVMNQLTTLPRIIHVIEHCQVFVNEPRATPRGSVLQTSLVKHVFNSRNRRYNHFRDRMFVHPAAILKPWFTWVGGTC